MIPPSPYEMAISKVSDIKILMAEMNFLKEKEKLLSNNLDTLTEDIEELQKKILSELNSVCQLKPQLQPLEWDRLLKILKQITIPK